MTTTEHHECGCITEFETCELICICPKCRATQIEQENAISGIKVGYGFILAYADQAAKKLGVGRNELLKGLVKYCEEEGI